MTRAHFKIEKLTRLHVNNILYYFIIGIFFALIAAKDLLAISIPSLLYTVIWVFAVVYFDLERAAAFTVCATICFASSLSVTIPIAVFVLMALWRGVRKAPLGCFLCAFILIFAEMTHFFDLRQEFRPFINISMFIILVVIVTTLYLVNDYDPVLVLKHYVWFFVFLATDILVYTIQKLGSVAVILSSSFRIGQTDILEDTVSNVAMSINANGLAFLALIAVAVTLVLLNQKQFSKRIAIPVIIYCSLIGALTISKTFVISFVLLMGIFYFWYLGAHSKNIVSGIGLTLLFIGIFYLFTFTEVYQNILFRFESNDLTTGRTDIFANYIEYMSEHPDKLLFGIGLQQPNIKAGIESVPHNAFLETYVCLGLVGLFAAILLVTGLFRLFRRKHISLYHTKPKFLNYIPFGVYLFFIQSFQFIKISYIFVSLILVFLCILVQQKDNAITKTV